MKNFNFLYRAFRCWAFLVAVFWSVNVQAQFKIYGTPNTNDGFGNALPLDVYYYLPHNTSIGGNSAFTGGVTKVKANTNLDWVWTKDFVDPNGGVIAITKLSESIGGNIIALGSIRPTTSLSDMKLIVIELSQSTGAVLQTKIIDPPGTPRLLDYEIVRVSDCGAACGGAYIVKSWIDGSGGDDILVLKLDFGLNLVWAHQFDGGNSDDQPNGMIPSTLNPGGVVIGGESNQGGWKGFLVEIKCDGSIDVPRSVAYTPTNGNDLYFIRELARAFNGDILAAGMAEVPAFSGHGTGVMHRINGANQNPIWHRILNIQDQSISFYQTTQLKKTNGDVYASYQTPDLVNGNFEGRVVKFAFTTGLTNKYRDLGRPHPSIFAYPLLAATASKLVVSGAKSPGQTVNIGQTDAWLGTLTSALTTCGTPVATTLPNYPLTKVPNYNFQQTNVLSSLAVSQFCNGASSTWSQLDACPISNKPAEKTGEAATTDNFMVYEQSIMANDGVGLAPLKFTESPAPQKAANRTAVETTNFDFELYPNPATSTVEIVFSNEATATGQTLQVFDLMGKLVKTQPITDATTEQVLDIGDLPRGVYLVKIGDGVGQKLTKM